SLILAVRYRSRLYFPAPIVCLFACLAFAGTSALWAFKPEVSFIRFLQQAMVVSSIVLPGLIATQNADLMRGTFFCFAVEAVLNVFFVIGNSPAVIAMYKGYPGYFEGKNYLGEFAVLALLLSFHEIFYPGWRRTMGIIIITISLVLLFLSNSKTAVGL